MDYTVLITFLGGGSLVASLIVQVAKKFIGDISARYGALITQLVLLVVSVILAVIVTVSPLLPTNWLATAGAIWAGAVLIYEFLYKALWQQAIKGQV